MIPKSAVVERRIVVAGAGIAGLTAALAFAAKGNAVTIFERAARLEEVGAGLQLSPNATRILRSLGVLDALRQNAVAPVAIVLKDARTLASLARVPLGDAAEERWGAPYLVAHRADLQRALLDTLGQVPAVTLTTGAEVIGADLGLHGARIKLREQDGEREIEADLLVGADGVWSGLRRLTAGKPSRYTGYVAYRAVLSRRLEGAIAPDAVTAVLSPDFHLIAYPLRGGTATNLVVVARSAEIGRGWANVADRVHLRRKMERAAPALSAIIEDAGAWTAWPIHAVDGRGGWTDARGLALIGDAAHALSPYAAQGAAMAIEDAAALAALTAGTADLPAALTTFEQVRSRRVRRVARRGDFNRFVWHAEGPAALARNLVLRLRSGPSLAADLDWLYGYDADAKQP
ncbi:FAD-dependent monooxygenase [Chelativorans sp. AA-79]|uniref:FAD-dependent monooxygenase n=1 Tax=Chelativorans sp. AA-79 TaxID=3028735 RepID=UPI0023FA47F8|nr:FAD-dependent monooxygenase [Chelativorans sp. AA-79]WEX07493.1 FAD-dependent monooxygenase [Chelativorans sp. AA-79]